MQGLALALLFVLGSRHVQASHYQLPPFDTVNIKNLRSNQATVVIVPSLDQSFSLNASQSGVTFSVYDGTLRLSQRAKVSHFLENLLHGQDDEEVQTGTIYVEVGGPLRGVISDTVNDVVVGDKFSSPGFTATLTSSGKLVVLGITTPCTSVWNTGGGTLYIQGDLGAVKVTASGESGTYLGSSVHYSGDIASVDVQLSGPGNLIVATSSNETSITGQSLDSGRVLHNQGSCDVAGRMSEAGSRCEVARIRVPVLPQYWTLSDAAQAAAAAQLPPPPPPPSPPPPMPVRGARVTPEEVTNLITPLAVARAPSPPDANSAAGAISAPDAAPAAAPRQDIFPAWAVPSIASDAAGPEFKCEAAPAGAYIGAPAPAESAAGAPDLAPTADAPSLAALPDLAAAPDLAPAPFESEAASANIGSAGTASSGSAGEPRVRATGDPAGADSAADSAGGLGAAIVSRLSTEAAGK